MLIYNEHFKIYPHARRVGTHSWIGIYAVFKMRVTHDKTLCEKQVPGNFADEGQALAAAVGAGRVFVDEYLIKEKSEPTAPTIADTDWQSLQQ